MLDQRCECEVLTPRAAKAVRGVLNILESEYNVRLLDVCPSAGSPIKEVEQLLFEPLEKKKGTIWKRIRHLSVKKKVSIAGSLFLTRKVLREGMKPDKAGDEERCREYFDKMTKPVSVAEDYATFAEKLAGEVFYPGWDKGLYRRSVLSHVSSDSSSGSFEDVGCGGSMRDHSTKKGRDVFIEKCLSGTTAEKIYPCDAVYACVPSGGKMRGVTLQHPQNDHLSPLHKSMYDHLSRFDWLLRGDAKRSKFKSFGRKAGEVFVSGDYESATDNLSLEMSERILRRIFDNSSHIPEYVKKLGMTSLRSILMSDPRADYNVASVVQERGQLMGNFLSFPLLCLQNYCAFRYLTPPGIPVKINGDDIVFRAKRSVAMKWIEGVNQLGFKLSKGKTLIASRFFSLNSSFFVCFDKGVEAVPVIRMKMTDSSVPNGDDFRRFCRGWKGRGGDMMAELWLRHHKRQILSLGHSIVRGLGIPASNRHIHMAGLKPYEAFFRGSTRTPAIAESRIPIYHRKRGPERELLEKWCYREKSNKKEVPDSEEEFRKECFEAAWKPRDPFEPRTSKSAWWRMITGMGHRHSYFQWRDLCRRAKDKKLRSSLLNPTLIEVSLPKKGDRFWFRIPEKVPEVEVDRVEPRFYPCDYLNFPPPLPMDFWKTE